MAHRLMARLSFLVALVLACNSPALAQIVDPHQLYEEGCARCHTPHAVDFVHDSLERSGDAVVGRKNGKELRSFLATGHGRLTAAEIDVMVDHLTAILQSGSVFRDKCLICHGRAVVLARSQLIARNGRLVGRYTGRDIGMFLESHGRLEGDEVATVLRMLQRQLATKKN